MKKIKITHVLVSTLSILPMMAVAAQPKEVTYENGVPVEEQYSDYEYVYEDENGQPIEAAVSNTGGDSSPSNSPQLIYDNQPVDAYVQDQQGYDSQPPVDTHPQQAQPNAVAYEAVQPARGAQGARGVQTATPGLTAVELSERLLNAVRDGKLGDVRWLLRKGADPDYKAHANALSPLDLVVKGGWVDVAGVFQAEGINFAKKGTLGVTFLHQAAAAGKLPMVQFLVGAGISPNVVTSKGWTPLHHAARFGHAQVVDYLLRAGANAEKLNSDGFRAQELALKARHSQVLPLF